MPASFASKIYGMTKTGQRVVISPRDLVPTDVQHANLPAPKFQPAPGETQPAVTAENASSATMNDAGGSTTPTTGSVADAALKEQPRPAKLLNPLDYAVALRAEAKTRTQAAAQALKAAKAAESPKAEDVRAATRALKTAENAVVSVNAQIAAIQRRIERTSAEVENAKKAAAAKGTLDVRIVDAQNAIEEAQKAKAAKELELKDAWQAASKAESEGKEADAKAADKRAGDLEDEIRSVGKTVKTAERALKNLQDQIAATERRQARAQEDLARVEASLAKLNEERVAQEAKLPDAKRLVEEAQAAKAAKDKEHKVAEQAVEEAENAVEAVAAQIREATRRLEPVSVFVSRKTGRLYVRQGFRSVFDVAITIKDRERSIGTHVYVSTEAVEGGARLRWAAVSVPDDEEKKPAARDGKHKRHSSADDAEATGAVQLPPETPKSALDRLEIPEDAKQRLAELTWVGSMLTISDRSMSGETNESTDFVILTRSHGN